MRLDLNAWKRPRAGAAAAVAVVAGVALAAYAGSRAWDSSTSPTRRGGARNVPRETAEYRSPSGRYVYTRGRLDDLGSGRSWVVGPIYEPLWSPNERHLCFVRYGFAWTRRIKLFVLDLAEPASTPRRVLTADELRVRWIGPARLGFWRMNVELGPTDAVVGRSAASGFVTPSDLVRTSDEAGRYADVTWPPGGDYVVYTLVGGEQRRAPTGQGPRRK